MPSGDMWEMVLDPGKLWSKGWPVVVWLIFLVLVFSAFRSGKIYLNSIGKGEIGGRDFFGFAVWPVLFGPGISIKGLSTVRRAAKTPTRIDLVGKVRIEGKVFDYAITVNVLIMRQWKHLKKAIYGFIDEDKGDLDNPERTAQAKAAVEAAIRRFLEQGHYDIDLQSLRETTIEYTDLTTYQSYELALEKVYEVMFGMMVTSIAVTQLVPSESQVIASAITRAPEGTLVVPLPPSIPMSPDIPPTT